MTRQGGELYGQQLAGSLQAPLAGEKKKMGRPWQKKLEEESLFLLRGSV